MASTRGEGIFREVRIGYLLAVLSGATLSLAGIVRDLIVPTRLAIPEPEMFAVQGFFNSVGDASFVRMVDHLTRGVGYSADDAHCCFPSDLDPGEESFVGVRFSLYEDSVTISFAQLLEYLRAASAVYTASHPCDRPLLDKILREP